MRCSPALHEPARHARLVWLVAALFSAACLVACAPREPEDTANGRSGLQPSRPGGALSPAATAGAETARASVSHVPKGFEGTCVVKPLSVVRVKAQVSGEIQRVFVQAGDNVRRGDMLVELSTRELNSRVERLKIAQERIQRRRILVRQQMAGAQRELDALRPLYSEMGVAKTQLGLGERQLELDVLNLESKDLEVQLAELLRDVALTKIRSPVDATVLSRSVEPGNVVSSALSSVSGGDVLLELANLRTLNLDCSVHASDARWVQPASTFMALVDPREINGLLVEVSRVSPLIDSVGGVPQMRFVAKFLTSPGPAILSGMRLTLRAAPVKDAPGTSSKLLE